MNYTVGVTQCGVEQFKTITSTLTRLDLMFTCLTLRVF